MNPQQWRNEPISVEGNIRGELLFPKKITWREKQYQVISVGRQWAEGEITHILLEVDNGSRMEVTYAAKKAWRLLRYWAEPPLKV